MKNQKKGANSTPFAMSQIKHSLNKNDKPPVAINNETAQASVPIIGIHEQYGLIETYEGCFVKAYQVGDNNYLTAPEEEQLIIYKGFRKLLNSFGQDCEFAIVINNKSVNQQEFCDNVLLKEVGDEYDHLRKQMNEVILRRMTADGRNGIVKDKYLVVAVHALNVKKAAEAFSRLDADINKSLATISSSATPLSLEELLDTIYMMYNDGSDHLIQRTRVVAEDGHVSETKTFDYENMRNMGLTINDLIAPSSVQVEKKQLILGNKYARVLKVSQLPSQLTDDFLTNVTDMGFNCVTTMNYKPIPAKKAEVIVSKNLSFIRDEKQRAKKAGQKAGVYDDSYVSQTVLEREEEALLLRRRMHEEDEKLFDTTLTVTIFADTMDKLNEYTESLITEYKKASVTIDILTDQQEEGFYTTLPLCYNQMLETRTLTSSSSAIFLPFSSLEFNDAGGINYSCNMISKNLIVYDRMQAANFNGFVLGSSGSGKSFTSKVEMLNVFLKTNSEIIVIDPEDEYGALAKLLGGEVVKIVPGGKAHINPLEIVTDYELEDETNPVNAKAAFVQKIIECVLESPFGVGAVQKTIIDECVHKLYAPFIKDGKLREVPPSKMPTLTDLQRLVSEYKEPEAREIAWALKRYTGSGSSNTFGDLTNVKLNKRFVVYQIRDIGDELKPLAMLTILDHIWNTMVENKKIGINTWVYIDEIYLLFAHQFSASFLNILYKRARKYGGVMTGITQNISSMLSNEYARDMIQNSCLVQILAQSGPDREGLRDLLQLSDQQLSYITGSMKGQGLIYSYGRGVIPFHSVFPKDNDLYRVLTSDMKEIKAFEEQERRAARRKEVNM